MSGDSDIPRQLRQQGVDRFDYLHGCLPGRADPTDVDHLIERRGQFLFIENKRPMQTMPRGQEIAFDRLIELFGDRVRLLVVIGHPPDQIESYRWWRQPVQQASVHDIRDLVRRWYDWASEQRAA